MSFRKTSKYKNKKTIFCGFKFDSKAEAAWYHHLHQLQQLKVISDLELQPKFELTSKSGKKIATYKADFRFRENNKTVVDDVKGVQTSLYKLKRKFFLAEYPDFKFREIYFKNKKFKIQEF